ncbi:type VI secretion system baseplate subunit TssG, partial [Chromobacterium haemolyticum]|uniref:type VI secretion system baseplate subunit TssG n=1 Tax=Chromobacterium haemolyticum TaxID=394935 RepID=UPI00244D3F99
MAAPARPQPGSVAERLLTRPQGFEFAQAVMLLERLTPQAAPLGQGADPAREALRLRGPLLPAFAASELSALEPGALEPGALGGDALGGDARDGQPALDVESFGLGGPDGPLPYAYQEWLQQRRQDKDHAPAEFLQLFQHRLLALLYRAQRKYR